MMEVSLREYADVYNPVLNRRGFRMSEGYLYRLIRQQEGKEKAGKPTRELWFKYKFVGDKDMVRVLVEK